MSENFTQILDLLNSKQLPSHSELFLKAERACTVLEEEICSYRPACTENQAGSLLDFIDCDLPTIVVPDLHARPWFLADILCFNLSEEFIGIDNKGITVFDALEKGLIRVICVGDALHSEWGTRDRWQRALEEFADHIFTGENMVEEMIDGLNLLCGLMKLKELFPANFHFLKGNHENILNLCGDGDFSFRKFADEGNMVRTFITEYYGEDVLYILACTENKLPLIAVTNNCVVSHAEAAREFSREELINAKNCEGIVAALTWTDNGSAENDSAEKIMKNLTGRENVEDMIYLGGHRPVTDNYSARQNGKYIQIHNPGKENIALVHLNRKFLPDYDIVSVKKQEKVDE